MQRSFGLWLIAVFAVSIFVPLAILSIALAQYFNRMFAEETESAFENTLHIVSQHITAYMKDLGRLTMTPYFQKEVMENLTDINSGRYFEHSPTSVRVNRQLHTAFSTQLGTARNDVSSVLFTPYDPEEDISFLIIRHSGSITFVRDIGARESEWFKGAVEADGAVYFTHLDTADYFTAETHLHFYHTDERLKSFSVARLITDTATMRPVGVIKIDALDTVIRNIFESIPITDNSKLVLLDQNDQVIYGDVDFEPALLAAAIRGDPQITGGHDSYLISATPISGTPWKLCYFASQSDIRQRTTSIYYVTALFGLAFLVVALLIFYNSSRKSVRAMNQLLVEMKKIASGDLDVRLDIRQKGYLATIADALTQTSRRLDRHIKREYKAVLNQRNAEYLALQAQINPHFLSNILSSFVTLNRIGERDTLEKSIINLSNLFRYVENNENLSTVHGEMTFLGEYISLQQLRFEDKLEFSFYCTHEAEPIVLPKLLVQPLVENAIIHGMEPHGNSLKIEVSAMIETRGDADTPCLIIVISDNGMGFDDTEVGKDSVGLSNIIERLELFDSRSIFNITSKPGHGCRCEIIVPIDEEEDEEEDDDEEEDV